MNTKTPEEILKSKESYNKDEWSEQPLFAMGDVIKAMKEYASQFTDASRREMNEKEIVDLSKEYYPCGNGDPFYKERRGAFIEGLKEALNFSQSQKEGWIPVTERLQEVGEYVLTCFSNNVILLSKLMNGGWQSFYRDGIGSCEPYNTVTHWQAIKILTEKYDYDFDSDWFNDEEKLLVDDVFSATVEANQSQQDKDLLLFWDLIDEEQISQRKDYTDQEQKQLLSLFRERVK